jgi:hypothetical protein
MAFNALILSTNICLHSNTHIFYFEQNAEKMCVRISELCINDLPYVALH